MLYKIQCMPNEKVHSAVTGHMLFIADSKGFYITEDSALAERASNKYPVWVIDATFAGAETLVKDVDTVEETEESTEQIEIELNETEEVEETEEDLRAKAKEAGIKHWHVKSIDTLKEELGEE